MKEEAWKGEQGRIVASFLCLSFCPKSVLPFTDELVWWLK